MLKIECLVVYQRGLVLLQTSCPLITKLFYSLPKGKITLSVVKKGFELVSKVC